MSKNWSLVISHLSLQIVAALCALTVCSQGMAAEANKEKPIREVYVPFADLKAVLQCQPQRVLLGRDEYEALLKKAKQTPVRAAPLPATIAAAEYDAVVGRQRAEIAGTLTIEVLEDGLHMLPLDISGVGLLEARLDDRAAPIGIAAGGMAVVFVEGVGQHRLELKMTAPLSNTAARQTIAYRLPRPPAAKLRLSVPGDVELKGGAEVISRQVNAEANETRFELMPRAGDVSLLLTVNSHLRSVERAVLARASLNDEITLAGQRLRATFTLDVLNRATDQFRFAVPEGFEIVEVATPLLARWDVRLREQTVETVTLGITALGPPPSLDAWTAPRLVPLDVEGCATVFGLLVAERLRAE